MRAIFSTEDINSNGFWVQSSGIDTQRYEKNPVLLNQHNDWQMPIGRVENLRIENGVFSGDVVFDENDPQGKILKHKYENGFMSGFSIGIEIIETSQDNLYLKSGQTRATVTKCELIEISAVTIPANASAVRLYKQGNKIELSNSSINLIETIKLEPSMKKVIVLLGLQEDAGEEQIAAAIAALKRKESESAEMLKKQKEAFMGYARKHNLITDENAASVERLYDLDSQLAYQMIEQKQQTRISEMLKKGSGNGTAELKTFADYQNHPEAMETLRKDNFSEYKRLYELHYGRKLIVNG
jgi:HK97 family phage prohead protease